MTVYDVSIYKEHTMIKRELYLRRIRKFYDSELIKVITGVRRCGKSTLLKQIVEELIDNGINESNIININFEDYSYRELTNPENLHTYIFDRIHSPDTYYLFFDEIQNVTDFERVVNSFRATQKVSIFMTGSNSVLLSGELATHLGEGQFHSL